MLLQFSCSNHRSIKDKVTFSMLSSESGKRASSIKTLRIATIYGSNGSGSSSSHSLQNQIRRMLNWNIKIMTNLFILS